MNKRRKPDAYKAKIFSDGQPIDVITAKNASELQKKLAKRWREKYG